MLTKLQHLILEFRVKGLDTKSISNLLNVNSGLLNAIENRTQIKLNSNLKPVSPSGYHIFERYLKDYAEMNNLHQEAQYYRDLEVTLKKVCIPKSTRIRRFRKSRGYE
jgi:hypothetical protein